MLGKMIFGHAHVEGAYREMSSSPRGHQNQRKPPHNVLGLHAFLASAALLWCGLEKAAWLTRKSSGIFAVLKVADLRTTSICQSAWIQCESRFVKAWNLGSQSPRVTRGCILGYKVLVP